MQPTQMIRSRRQIAFDFGWCSFLFARHSGVTVTSYKLTSRESFVGFASQDCGVFLISMIFTS
jgi:hypothetical protein